MSGVGSDLLRKLSRFELKQLAQHLAERCGGDAALQAAVQHIATGRLTESSSPTIQPATSQPGAAPAPSRDASSEVKSSSTGSANASPSTADDATAGKPVKQEAKKRSKKDKVRRAFEMDLHAQRHVALHVAYFGEKYGGFASQDHREDTVEYHLFHALNKACLITSRAESGYSRCGRTDLGVSALGQIVSLTVRSSLRNPQPPQAAKPATKERPIKSKKRPRDSVGADAEEAAQTSLTTVPESDDDEINYPHVLNRLLPDDIMVLGWAPAPNFEFKARFNAESRTYRYYFCRRGMDLAAMRTAANFLVGAHDFRNFCKMDVTNVKNFCRAIRAVDIIECQPDDSSRDAMCYLRVHGTAFLWHQIRCIASVLFMVGLRQEQPEIVKDLLDIDKVPRKPVYDIAPALPLILYESEYLESDLKFRYEVSVLNTLRQRLEYRKAEFDIKAKMTQGVLDYIDHIVPVGGTAPLSQSDAQLHVSSDFCPARPGMEHIPMDKRQTCDSYDERVENLSDRKRAVVRRRHGWDL